MILCFPLLAFARLLLFVVAVVLAGIQQRLFLFPVPVPGSVCINITIHRRRHQHPL